MHILAGTPDLASLKLLTFLLEDAGYRVSKALTSASIVRMVEHGHLDLVILDVSLPDGGGFEICRRIRRTSDIPIIFLSARGHLAERIQGLQLGGDDYVVKPFEPAELLARIAAVLRRCTSDYISLPTRINQGDLALDPVEQAVCFDDDRTVVLTPVEFRLLYYLVQNAGQTLNTDQIIDHVWDGDCSHASNLVAVYIRRLRTKLESDPDHPRRLTTVTNLGYTFRAQATAAVADA